MSLTIPEVGDFYIVLYDTILDGRAGHGRNDFHFHANDEPATQTTSKLLLDMYGCIIRKDVTRKKQGLSGSYSRPSPLSRPSIRWIECTCDHELLLPMIKKKLEQWAAAWNIYLCIITSRAGDRHASHHALVSLQGTVEQGQRSLFQIRMGLVGRI